MRKWTPHKRALVWLLIPIFISNCIWTFTDYLDTFFKVLSGWLILVSLVLFVIWTKTGSIYTEEEKKKIPRFRNREGANDHPQ